MNSTLPEMMEQTATLLRRGVERQPAPLSPLEAEQFAAFALSAADMVKGVWRLLQGSLRQGLEGGEARKLTTATQRSLAASAEYLAASLELVQGGVSPSTGESLQRAAAELNEFQDSAATLVTLLDRPRPPLNRQQLAESYAALARGEGEDLDDLIARLEAGEER